MTASVFTDKHRNSTEKGKGRLFRYVPLLLAALLLASCGDGSKSSPPDPGPQPEGGFTVRPEALWKTGLVPAGDKDDSPAWMIASGQRITPLQVAGSRLLRIHDLNLSEGLDVEEEDLTLPLGMVLHPGGKYLLISTAGRRTQAILVINVETGEIVDLKKGDYFLGLAARPPAGDEVYVSAAGRDTIETYGFDETTGELERRKDRDMPVPGFAGGLTVSADGSRLFAVSQFTGFLYVFDLESASLLGRIKTRANPYTVAVHPQGHTAYVSCVRPDKVQVFDVSDPSRIRRVETLDAQKNPEALLVNPEGTRLYVTNADEDSVGIYRIDTDPPEFLKVLDLRSTPGLEYGSSPNALAISTARHRLYVAQAGLNKLAVIDLETGAHLGDIPTAWYPTAVALHAVDTKENGVTETLFVANGKGIGTPWEGYVRTIPGRISILPVPPDGDLPALTATVAENNAFPSRLFEFSPGTWNHPIPRERGGPTPIKYVFLVIRENKTYDRLLGAYQPPTGEADRDPRWVMEDYEILLPNLYKLAERFIVCDNYFSNAQASNQGHQILTASTANTYIEKIVFADDRPLPFELEQVFNPSAWPIKDYIFQNAMRNGISFRDYGEGVGVGRDFLILDEEYVHRSLVDPPWYWMFTKDESKMKSRFREWESDRFAGPNFPRLIFMLLPNDHTWGGRGGFPSEKSMIADNDLATGMFVDWLSKSPYWMESVAFITEDDPQGGTDHVDPHRTMMLVVSPWVKRGAVSPVRYNEAHLYATVEYILGLPPMTIFDEVAQPMYDLFDFEPDGEVFDHEPKQYPWETNPFGTLGSRGTADMEFAEPDEAEGLIELLLAMEEEEREAERPSRRLYEGSVRLWEGLRKHLGDIGPDAADEPGRPDPIQVLEAMRDAAEDEDRSRFEGFLDAGHKELVASFIRKREAVFAEVLPKDPIGELLDQFRRLSPRPVQQRFAEDRAEVEAVYSNGIRALLRFCRENGQWQFDFSHHFAPSVRILDDSCRIHEAYEIARSLNKEK